MASSLGEALLRKTSWPGCNPSKISRQVWSLSCIFPVVAYLPVKWVCTAVSRTAYRATEISRDGRMHSPSSQDSSKHLYDLDRSNNLSRKCFYLIACLLYCILKPVTNWQRSRKYLHHRFQLFQMFCQNNSNNSKKKKVLVKMKVRVNMGNDLFQKWQNKWLLILPCKLEMVVALHIVFTEHLVKIENLVKRTLFSFDLLLQVKLVEQLLHETLITLMPCSDVVYLTGL